MEKYRKKPEIVEVIKLTKDNFNEVKIFVGDRHQGEHYNNEVDFLKHENPIGIFLKRDKVAYLGDYIIKDVDGEFYPCKPNLFEQTYEKI